MSDRFWCETHTGKRFYPLDPDRSETDIIDIIHALSNTCRYNGHCSKFYSVASHSIVVSGMVSMYTSGWDTIVAALAHDFTEAYLGDMVTPMKNLVPKYVEVEKQWQEKIDEMIGINVNLVDYDLIKAADLAALRVEASMLMVSGGKNWNLPDSNQYNFDRSEIRHLIESLAGSSGFDEFNLVWQRLNR